MLALPLARHVPLAITPVGELRPVRLALLASIKMLVDKAPVLPALQERFRGQ